MNHVNAVSKTVLMFGGLAAMVLGARIGSAPDVFAFQMGLDLRPAADILALARWHAGSLFGLGLFALLASFAAPAGRWAALAVLLIGGVAAWFGLWQFAEGRGAAYAAALKTLAIADALALALVTVFRDADRPAPKPTDASVGLRWG